MVDPDSPERLMLLPISLKTNKNVPISAVVISTSENPPTTPFEYMKGPYSGYDISNGYVETKIDGQEAIAVENWTWIVVNTPDNKRRISIALLPDEKGGSLLFTEMGVVINSLVFDK